MDEEDSEGASIGVSQREGVRSRGWGKYEAPKVLALALATLIAGWGIHSIISEGAEPAEVAVKVGEFEYPAYYPWPLYAYIDVTLEGERQSYALTLKGPEDEELGHKRISEDVMEDGSQVIRFYIRLERGHIPEGEYVLEITDSNGFNVYKGRFSYSRS